MTAHKKSLEPKFEAKRCEWDSNPRNNGFAIHRLRPLGYRTVLFFNCIVLVVSALCD